MSAPSPVINPKGPRPKLPAFDPLAWVATYFGSTVGQKILVGTTGVLLVTFVVFHMIGNLKMFSGPESINKYAYFLKHDLGVLIWIARAGLLGLFALHVMLAIRLKAVSAEARPVGYTYQTSAQATLPSKTMLQTGIVVGLFVMFHLAHYTFGWIHTVPSPSGKGETNYLSLMYTMPDGKEVHDVYRMVVAGFSTGWISAIYLVANVVLFIHLSHGIQSSLQTLGLVNRRTLPLAKLLGLSVAGVILLGNTAIVLAVWTGWVK